jgi:hypothetical protein
MTEARVTCDRCGEEITSDRTLLTVECGPARSHRPAVDLCRACAIAFVAWVTAGVPDPEGKEKR